jgi:syntaxin 1B/2/3
MATLVLEQDESVRQIETTAVQANTDVENGYVSLSPALLPPTLRWLFLSAPNRLKQTQTAVKSARAARKKRWFCFGVIVCIVIVVVVVVVVEVRCLSALASSHLPVLTPSLLVRQVLKNQNKA